jgi:hypothetical protein
MDSAYKALYDTALKDYAPFKEAEGQMLSYWDALDLANNGILVIQMIRTRFFVA